MFLKIRSHIPHLIRFMSSECVEIREMAAMIVRDYLTGPWKKVTPNNIIVQRVNGGLSNWLYQISLPTVYQNQTENSDPKTVLLRFHGQVHSESAFEHIITESVIFTLLSERRLGPKLHGVFPGGRIEEFIQARPLKTNELWDPKISSAVATKMAQVHSLHVPISKKEKYMFDLMGKWLTQTEDDLEQYEPNDVETQKLFEKFKTYDLRSEISWLRHYLPSINSPVVFCHNDMQEGNILISNDSVNSKQPNLVLIDYEYCSYNYRGFEFANHFLEYTINYCKKEYPNFSIDPSAYPSVEHQVKFIRQYLSVYESLQMTNKSEKSHASFNQPLDYNRYSDTYYHSDLKSDITETEAQLLHEISNFRLLSHLLWGIWAAMHSQSTIEFGYWEYCIARLEAYFQTKKEVLSYEIPGMIRRKP